MGKGDNRSKKGKRVNGSFGVLRLKKEYMKTEIKKIEESKK